MEKGVGQEVKLLRWGEEYLREMQTGTAERVFAQEFNAGGSGRSEEEVLTLLGLRCRRIFVVGALTEIHGKAGGPVHARIADPTGTFLVRIPSREEYLAERVTALAVPSFVALTGKCHCALRSGETQPYITLETMVAVDREARDAWIARTAVRTLDRIERLQKVLGGGSARPDDEEAIRICCIDPARLRAMAGIVLSALDVLKRGPAGGVPVLAPADPKERILAFLTSPRDPPLFGLDEILAFSKGQGFSEKEVRLALESLLEDGECYMPRNGLFKLV